MCKTDLPWQVVRMLKTYRALSCASNEQRLFATGKRELALTPSITPEQYASAVAELAVICGIKG